MSQAENLRLTEEGMVRNFGNYAAAEAERITRRYAGYRDKSGHIFWTAVTRHLREKHAQATPAANAAAADGARRASL